MAFLVVAFVASGACRLPTGSSDLAFPVLGDCGLSPNYVDSALSDQPPPRLLRWRSFPVRLHVDTGDTSGRLASLYRDGAERGAASWSVATDGHVGQFELVDLPSQAQIIVRFRSGSGAAASTTIQFSDRLMIQATTDVTRPNRDVELVDRGQRAQVLQIIAQVVGHEMGHALGIMLHSPNPRDVMARLIRVGADGNAITPADRHTVLQAYCQ